MNFFKNILLFYNDELIKVKAEVIRLVRKNQVRLKIINVFDNFEQYLELLPPSASIDELKDVVISERRKDIMSHFEADSDITGRIEIIFKFGNPAVETIKEAIRGKHDVVIKTATGNKTLKERLLGNVAVKLLRKCPCPVLIIKPSTEISFKKILVAIDPEKESEAISDDGNNASKKIVDISTFLARQLNSHLDILHCWRLPGETLLSSGRTRIDREKLKEMRVLAEKIHKQRVNKFMAGFNLSDISHSIFVYKGDPGDIIIDHAEKNEIDLIVMGTIGRSGLSGVLIGNTAEKVIDHINCSILTVKPDNFQTPIRL
jgi:universal stress protein E